MPTSQLNISSNTPLGANLAPGGATFRTWAPTAREVYIALEHPTGSARIGFSEEPG